MSSVLSERLPVIFAQRLLPLLLQSAARKSNAMLYMVATGMMSSSFHHLGLMRGIHSLQKRTKPKTEDDAFSMLKMLSGRTHSVYTGVALIFPEGSRDSFYSETRVTMFDNSDDLIRDYISTGEPMDKAGAYGIQGTGAYLVEKVDGDYGTIVGLPVSIVFRKLREYTLLHSK